METAWLQDGVAFFQTYGLWGLLAVAFLESFISPILPDLLLIPMALANPDQAISTLSGGNQQKIVLAKWVLTQPKILILDSPTVGVDVGAKASIYQLIHQLAEEGISILLISDEVPEVYFNCDRVLHFSEGTVVGEYLPRGITQQQLAEAVNA